MSSKIEQNIRNLLKEKDSVLVADELMKLWDTPNLTSQDKNAIAHFLMRAGFLSTLKNQILEDLSKGKKVNWHSLLYFLTQPNLSTDKIDSIYVGLIETQEVDEIIHFKELTKYSKFKIIYDEIIAKKQKNLFDELNKLKTKLKHAINDKNQAEIQRLTLILDQKFSFDGEAKDLTSDIELAKVRKILKKKEATVFENLNDSVERSKEFKKMAKSYIEKAKADKSNAYHLAISLLQMDAYETALEVLELSKDGTSKDWLKIELLILNKKYIEALQFSFDLEKKYVSNPDTIFDTLYYRSLAFYELNEKEKAKNILKKILEVKPEHIKSKIKLGEWKDLN